ncbi:FG-GAP-like repeat-containing protein [Streptomyces fradiae]|uniref:FG-GAP-like repeat-containing protein n=1 Tax=Streptomyces fradiae TaxID=1906 RepID=UPI0034092084
MASARSPRRRLAASVALVLAVTVGAGVLASPGATASPAAATGAPALVPMSTTSTTSSDAVLLPVGAEVVSAGETGHLTSRKDDTGATVLEWRRTADGSVTPLGSGTVGHDSGSDTVVTGDGGSVVHLRDMAPGADWSASFDLAAEFTAGAKLVGVIGRNLYVKVPTTADYHELWHLTEVDGAARKTKLSSGAYGMDYKVVASTGSRALLLGTNRVFSGAGFRTHFWQATMTVGSDEVVDRTGVESIGPWRATSTGALTADYTARVEYPSAGPRIVVDGDRVHRDFPLDAGQADARVAGILGDTLLYGVPGTADGQTPAPLYARSVTDATAEPYRLLEHHSSVAHTPDGGLLVRGATADADGLFRVWVGDDGRPAATLVADTGRVKALAVTGSQVPATVDLERPGALAPMEWTLTRADAALDVTLTHTATGRTRTERLAQPASGTRFAFTWDGLLDGASAPNGAYTWQVTATRADGSGAPATASGGFRVTREANPHDYNDNGSTDVLARDASGVLWRDDLLDWPSEGGIETAQRASIGRGWQIYDRIEAAGDLAGGPVGDLVARDTSGVLWLYQGTGAGNFTARTQIGKGWQIYATLTGGSDLTGDGRADLLATDTAGDLWLYRGTGSATAPFAARVRLGGGWQVYREITAVGDIAGGAAGDLVARDAAGVLWLYQGNGAGNFLARVRVGSGWNAFTHLVGAGDVDADGRPDLVAYGPNGTYVYRSTGSATAPFSRLTTTLYTGEGTAFDTIA